MTGRAFIDRVPVHVHDLQASSDEFPTGSSMAHDFGHRTMLAVPLMRNDEAIGVLMIRRDEIKPFTDKQIELVTTFADQAVIAIENVRLFEAEQQRTRELSESLEQQTATSSVLSVISNSPTDVQPVLDAIVRTAVTLCNSHDSVILLRSGDFLRVAAHYGPMGIDFMGAPLARDWVSGRAVLDRAPVHVADLTAERDEFPLGSEIAIRLNQRTVLGLPLMREGQAIGTLFLRRTEVLPFSEKQIALLQTFADQAVIAIENVRLLDELRQSLQQQTATADVLKIISASTFDLKTVLNTLVNPSPDFARRIWQPFGGQKAQPSFTWLVMVLRPSMMSTWRVVLLSRDGAQSLGEYCLKANLFTSLMFRLIPNMR